MSAPPQAPNYIQSTGVTGVANKAITLPQPVVAGNLIIVAGHIWKATDPTGFTLTDGLGSSYTIKENGALSWSSGVSRGFLAYATAAGSGSCVITITPGGSSFIDFGAVEAVDTDAASLDVDGGESTATGTAVSTGITTGVNNVIAVAMVGPASPSTATSITPGASFMDIMEQEGNDNAPWSLAWIRRPTAGAVTFTWTLGTSREWRARSLSFKVPGGGGGFQTAWAMQANQAIAA